MRCTTKVRTGLLAAATLAATFPTGSHASATTAAPDGTSAHAGAGQPRTLTLITGDRVQVKAGGGMTVRAGEGRKNMMFTTRQVGKQRVVIPADARPLLNSAG